MVQFRVLILVLVFLALQFLIISRARAEYRVYLLGVKSAPPSKETKVLSTLDDIQYETYYKTTATQQTRIIDHWMCWGRTNDLKPYCSKPVTLRSPASQPAGGPVQTGAASTGTQQPPSLVLQ